jgi:hypothetical protein
MATYKVPQDVEAEDKLLGPFTLKQFIYLIIVFAGTYGTFMLARSGFTIIFTPLTLLPALFFGFMVFLGIRNQSQPAEIYLAAIVRFYFKVRKRIWDQDGIAETVKVTAPPKIEHMYTDGLSRTDVRSRLGQLSKLMDSRGWAAKDVRYQPNIVMPDGGGDDDRLISLPSAQFVEPTDIHASDDIMDEKNSPVAQHFDQMIQQHTQAQHQQAIQHMNDPTFNPYPQMHQQVINPVDESATTAPQPSPGTAIAQPQPAPKPTTPQQPPEQIQRLVNEGGDNLSVSTLAKEAERLNSLQSGDEIDLH